MQEESTTVLDQDQMEQVKARTLWEYTTKEEREKIKNRIIAIAPVARSPKAKDILHKISQEEKVEDREAALLCTLIKRVDAWGRNKLAFVARNASDEAGRLIASKVKLLKEAETAHNRLVESAKARVKKAMSQLQEQLDEELDKLSTDRDAAGDKIRIEFQPKLDQQEARLKAIRIYVTDAAGKFTSRIQGMPLYDLERIAEGKVVRVLEDCDGVEQTVEVMCPDMIRETVEGP